MAAVPDPYRALGLARGAGVDEVKRAYRRLAKEHHPDSGGERALPRFLEIQAAYEQLVTAEGRGQRSGSATASRAGSASWQADDARADATRRAYASRGRKTTGRTGASDRRGPTERAEGPGAQGPEASAEDTRRRRPPRRERPPNKATFGSTTYDGAEGEPFEPGWTGASWYGTSSGTYWTLNPREYADPRKHGPEYQARARRARAEAAADDDGDEPSSGPTTDPEAAQAEHEPPRAEREPPQAAPDGADVSADTRPGGSWWTVPRPAAGADSASRQGAAARPATEPGDRRAPRGRVERDEPVPPLDPGAIAAGLMGRLVESPPAGPVARLVTALAGGLPLAFGLAWLLGELTGCGRFAATCDPALLGFAWPAGVALVALLVLLPSVASLASIGSLALVLAGVPATIFLTATGGARVPDASGAVLGAILAVSWVVGLGYGVGRRRRLRTARRHVS